MYPNYFIWFGLYHFYGSLAFLPTPALVGRVLPSSKSGGKVQNYYMFICVLFHKNFIFFFLSLKIFFLVNIFKKKKSIKIFLIKKFEKKLYL